MRVLERKFNTEKVKKDFSKVVWIYDFWSSLTESKAAKKIIELAEIKNGENILEVAVGTGELFEQIVKMNTEGKNEGIDLSPSMLENAKKKLNNENPKNYNLTEGDAFNLKYSDNEFDLIINNYMFDLLPEKDFARILHEFDRVLKPGGRVAVSTMSLGNKWYNKMWFYISKYFPDLMTGCRPIDLKVFIKESGFENLVSISISQNTFPSEIIRAEKPLN